MNEIDFKGFLQMTIPKETEAWENKTNRIKHIENDG